MAPTRIMFIRHAEKPGEPPCKNDLGVKRSGEQDAESLTVLGWQRAGALAHFFSKPPLRPDVIFAAGIGENSPSRRPKQTVMPLAELLSLNIRDGHSKDEVEPLVNDVLTYQGIVLISWEHRRLPDVVAALPHAPAVPGKWCDDRFDVVWVLDRAGEAWTFSQVPQLLLAGDSKNPIPFNSAKQE